MNTDYNYSMVRLLILKKTENGYIYVKDNFKGDRDIDIGVTNKEFTNG